MNIRKLIAVTGTSALVFGGVLGAACTVEDTTPSAPQTSDWWNDPSILEQEADAGVDTPVLALGESVEITDANTGGTQRVTVSDPTPRVSDIWGETQGFMVTIEGLTGTSAYNPYYFEAETVDHFRVTPDIADEPTLGSGDIRAGQTVRGWIDYEAGQTIRDIHLVGVSMSDIQASWVVS